ncbi:T9SS type A sorting domain-containing protein [Nonlabens xiamenensis]|uniref:T9SS type A sorting domain-containing protein n=1 Tax=Nonlabens xiamenensis TaxID=2341043 RepID=UPI000F60F922|nr:T9SS type A sorting domain-containing protein [Nonlabens xiamenensis]
MCKAQLLTILHLTPRLFFGSNKTVNEDFQVGLIDIGSTAGVSDEFTSTIGVYPNPVDADLLYCNFREQPVSEIQFGIDNTLGQIVQCDVRQAIDGQIFQKMTDLSSGLFFIKVKQEYRQTTMKFMVE